MALPVHTYGYSALLPQSNPILDEEFSIARYFSHVTTWNNQPSIMVEGLKPQYSNSRRYDGFLFDNPWLKGVWFTVSPYIPDASCYPFGEDAEEYNPMLTLSVDKFNSIFNVADYDWFEVFAEPNSATGHWNIKIACIPREHAYHRYLMGTLNEKLKKIKNPAAYQFFRLGNNGHFYMREKTWISIFVVSEDDRIPLGATTWSAVCKIA